MLMNASEDVDQIARLAMSSVPSFGPLWACDIHLAGAGWVALDESAVEPALRAGLEEQLEALEAVGGEVEFPGDGWARAFALGGGPRPGFLFVGPPARPPTRAPSLLRRLSHQA